MDTAQTLEAWQKAMDAATAEKLHAERVNERLYVVRSTSGKGLKGQEITRHEVRLAFPKGATMPKIVLCAECKGWEMWEEHKSSRPCKHAGAVCKAECKRRRIRMPIWTPAAVEDETVGRPTTKSQLFRAE